MFIRFVGSGRYLLSLTSALVLIAVPAAGVASAAVRRGSSSHTRTTKLDPRRVGAIDFTPHITYKPIDIPGASNTEVNAVARTGSLGQLTKVVGVYDDVRGEHGFVMSLGHDASTLDFPGAGFTDAYGINRRRQIVGTYGLAGPSGVVCGFIYDAGTYTTIPNSCAGPGQGLRPSGINDAGDIVGQVRDTRLGGFLSVNGIVASGIKFPGSARTTLNGLNNHAVPEVVGSYFDSRDVQHGMAFIGSNAGAARSIDRPGAESTAANGVNDAGQIVGSYIDPGVHGFVDDAGRFLTIDYPGAQYTNASGIDDPRILDSSYHIVGTYLIQGGGFRGFIATVTPVLVAKGPPITFSAPKK